MENLNNDYRTSVIEALILSSPEPLPARKIAEVVEDMTPTQVTGAVEVLNEKYRQTDSSFRIRQISGGFQCYITEEYSPFVDELHTRRRNVRLSRPALETLAIIAYRQPVTKIDVEMIRGVASDSAIHTLLERKLVTMAGRAQTIGRPLLYKTTDEFLKYFNLNTLNDLPQMSEIEELIASDEDSSQQNLPLGPFASRYSTDKSKKLTIEKGPEELEEAEESAESDNIKDSPELELNAGDQGQDKEAEQENEEGVYIPAENSASSDQIKSGDDPESEIVEIDDENTSDELYDDKQSLSDPDQDSSDDESDLNEDRDQTEEEEIPSDLAGAKEE